MTSHSKSIAEASGMLLLFSFFALIEGVIRMTTYSKPTTGDVDYYDDGDGTQVPIVVLLAGGAAEVLFGMAGAFVAFFQLAFDLGGPGITLVFAILQAVLSWFVFTSYVLVQPILAVLDTDGVPDLFTKNEHRVWIIVGNLVGSFTFCLALQGGQFIMAMRLLAAQQRQVIPSTRSSLRTFFWSANSIVAAGSTLYVGIVLLLKDDVSNSTEFPIAVAPPHVVWFPIMSIVTGGVMLVYGTVGVLASFNRVLATTVLPFLFIVTTLAMMVNFSWTFGIVPGLAPPIPGAAQHAGLVLSVTILPVFHAWKTHHTTVTEEETVQDRVKMEYAPAMSAPQAPGSLVETAV